MSWIMRLSLILLVPCLGACNPVPSRNPLAPPSSAVAAPELLGSWIGPPAAEQEEGCKGSKSPGWLRVRFYPLPDFDGKALGIEESIKIDPDQRMGIKAVGYVTPLRNGRFLNIRVINVDSPLPTPEAKREVNRLTKNYVFAVYEVDQSSLRFAFLTSPTTPMASAPPFTFHRHPLAVSDNGLVDSSASIASYFGSLDEAALFQHFCLLRKAD